MDHIGVPAPEFGHCCLTHWSVPVVATTLVLQSGLHSTVNGGLGSLDRVFGEGTDQLHGELSRAAQVTPQVGLDHTRVDSIDCYACAWAKRSKSNINKVLTEVKTRVLPEGRTFQSFGQWACEQDVGQFALTVGFNIAVTLLAVDVVQINDTPRVGHRWQVNNPGRGRTFNQVKQQMRQQEVTYKTARCKIHINI